MNPAVEPNPPLVELRDAGIGGAEDELVLDGINWAVQPAEFWLVGGLQASGKSRLMNVAAGLQRPAKGRHRLFGRDTADFSADELLAERLRVGIVYDGGRLLHALTVAENVALPLQYHRELPPDDIAGAVAGLLEQMEMANRKPGHLSQGWQMRAALARALALQPDLLLLDNPTSSLDPRQIRWWTHFLSELHAGRTAVPKRVAIALATDDLRPWVGEQRQFVLLKKNHWRQIGGKAELHACDDPLLRELLAAESSGT
jgi:phospholipid/cholesterol/gamma-HCH transport system ATP-binding protein